MGSIDDSSAPKSIPSSGKLGPGTTAGTDRSINLVKNIKTVTGASEKSSLDELRSWFKTFVGSNGNFNNTGGSGSQVKMSDWYGVSIFGIRLRTKNETSSKYGTNNNAILYITGRFSQKYNYRLEYDSTNVLINRSEYPVTGLDGGTGNTGTYKKFKITPLYNSTTELPYGEFYFKPAYKGRAMFKGVNSTGNNSFGTTTETYFTYTGGAAPGKLSEFNGYLLGKEDPGSKGRDYGYNFVYP